jgi:hypothetical protein
VLEQLERSKSLSDLPDAVAKHARRLTLMDGDDDSVQVIWALWVGGCVRWSWAPFRDRTCLGCDGRFGLCQRRASQQAQARRKHSRSLLRSCHDPSKMRRCRAFTATTQLCKSAERAVHTTKWLIWQLALGSVALGAAQVRYITRPKSETMRVTRQLGLPPRYRRA